MNGNVGDKMKNWQDILRQGDYGEVRWQEKLSSHTTFRIGGDCTAMVLPHYLTQAGKILEDVRHWGVPFYVLGGGSNILAADEGFQGVVIKLGGHLKRLEITNDKIYAEAGLPLPALAYKAAEANLAGLAFAAGIPGTVGGAILMNAGAHGGQMADIVERITYYDGNGQVRIITAEEAGFSYRSSIFQKEPTWTILAVECRLKRGDKANITSQMAQYQMERRQRQPQGWPSAGSVFKNPPGDAAGRLIEAIGAKGWRIGDAQVSEIHGNFIVNLGNARSDEVLTLIERIQAAVEKQFGIKLEREIVLLENK